MLKILSAEHVGGYRLKLAFNDGFVGEVDLSGRLDGPIFRPLQDAQAFRQFTLTDHTVQWRNGADFAPEYLRELVASPADAATR